ncbi:MAG: hypothetical protein JWP88_761 [Flaviaesturariibacter sp.]|nr:hypothetical protein [Flaviaesturariibacter sp.]
MNEHDTQLEALQDIRRMMQRSSRFISLSGLSGIAAGICGLIGAWFAYDWISEYYAAYNDTGYTNQAFHKLKYNLFLLAAGVLGAALLSAFYFTWRKADKDGASLWNHTSRNLALNMAIPLVAGGFFILAMLQYSEWRFVAPASLIFYGLALVNGGKYTLSEIRYLGLTELLLGLISTQAIGYGLYFWAFGFGVLHILYGFAMWWKYERKPEAVK